MGPLGIVKPNPVFDLAFGLEPLLEFVQIDSVLLQRPPQAFDKDIDPLPGKVILRIALPGRGSPPGRGTRARLGVS